ncbi:ABC transporter permease subunit [Neorhizobium sp. T786]|uniref:ABC transporter permease n=1 Tax=Pseudorhizobium xiangyangii TaxID=2883104 RepID=UPI001CFFE42E|nr:ABC transporter permease subunit [Neorhizobium xiangyangii]MCB5205127.1 ABC transporter permease subunit [Neorhizobium xiangyangii]
MASYRQGHGEGRFAVAGRRLGRATLVVIAALLILLPIFGPMLAPNDPEYADILTRMQPPSAQYPLGTDAMGRCLFSRLLWGARITLVWSAVIVAAAASIGTLIGLYCGYRRGWVDLVMMRLVEGVSVLPSLAIAVVISSVLGLGLWALVISLIAVHWTGYARLVRNTIVGESGKLYVTAARAMGAPSSRIMLHHLLPNIGSPLLVLATHSMSAMMLSFAGLSYLGLGVEPGVAEWGRIIADGRNHMRTDPRLVVAPGLLIMAIIISLNLIGDALADLWRSGSSIQ